MAEQAGARLRILATGRAETPARTVVAMRDHRVCIDEPVERHGSDHGASPLELLAGTLIGCTNVIASRIAAEIGIVLRDMEIAVTLELDGRVLAGTPVDSVFPRVRLAIRGTSDADAAQIETLRRHLAARCPVSVLLRQAGAEIVEDWRITRAAD